MTHEELAAMTGQELLAFEREHHGDPCMSLLTAKGMQRVALRFWHVGAARTKADREAQGRRGVACIRRCFHPTPLVFLSQRGGADRTSAITALVPMTAPTRRISSTTSAASSPPSNPG
jgi:hypothetical protein